jgi:catalase (peroxidase I)
LINPTKVAQELDIVVTDGELKPIAEKFAQDQKAYHEAFKSGFAKLLNLGHDEAELTPVEHLIDDHPLRKFIDIYY